MRQPATGLSRAVPTLEQSTPSPKIPHLHQLLQACLVTMMTAVKATSSPVILEMQWVGKMRWSSLSGMLLLQCMCPKVLLQQIVLILEIRVQLRLHLHIP
jgi:hypothetical protein